MDEVRLFPDGMYRVTHDAGKVYRDGKVYWPSSVSVVVSKHQAIQMLQQIARYLEHQNVKGVDPEPLTFHLPGTVERIEAGEGA